MDLAAVGSNLKNKHRSTFRIVGVFFDHDGGSGSAKHVIDRKAIVCQGVVAVLGDPDVTGGDQSRELLPKARHNALSRAAGLFRVT